MTIQQNNNSRLYPRAYDPPGMAFGHEYSSRHEIPFFGGRAQLSRSQKAASQPQQSCHYCTSAHILPAVCRFTSVRTLMSFLLQLFSKHLLGSFSRIAAKVCGIFSNRVLSCNYAWKPKTRADAFFVETSRAFLTRNSQEGIQSLVCDFHLRSMSLGSNAGQFCSNYF